MPRNSRYQEVVQDDEEEFERLSEKEVYELRDLLERDKRARWLWASLRTWAIWIAAVLGGITLGWEALGKLLRAAVGKGG